MTTLSIRDVMHISFLKKEKFTGSMNGMRFRMEKKVYQEGTEEKPEERYSLLMTIWPEPFSYDKTPEDRKEKTELEFSEDGIREAVEWLNQKASEKDWTKEKISWREWAKL